MRTYKYAGLCQKKQDWVPDLQSGEGQRRLWKPYARFLTGKKLVNIYRQTFPRSTTLSAALEYFTKIQEECNHTENYKWPIPILNFKFEDALSHPFRNLEVGNENVLTRKAGLVCYIVL